MICGGQTIRPVAAAKQSTLAATGNPRRPSDEQAVKDAFTAHLKSNPKLQFNGKWKKVTVSKGKRSDKNWTSDEYSIRSSGKNEFILKHTHNYYKPSVKSMNWLECDTRYYVIKVSVLPNGKQQYEVTKYKGFYSNRVRNFSFVANTKAGRVLVPIPKRAPLAGRKLATPQIKRFSCSITAIKKFEFGTETVIDSKDYRAAVLTDKGLYHIRATFDTGLRKYFITKSRKWGSSWVRHGRHKPAPTHIVHMFNHACSQYIRADLRK